MRFRWPVIEHVSREISPSDDMNIGEASLWYFDAGEKAMRIIMGVLDHSLAEEHKIRQILDIPSGYGRVLRWLAACFPEATITACDTNVEAVDFVSGKLGAKGVYADPDIGKIRLPRNDYDLIWCGSLFTHFDKMRCAQLLDLLVSNLNYKGILVFTTHGRAAAGLMGQGHPMFGLSMDLMNRIIHDCDQTGFGYANYDERFPVYGISLSSPSYVVAGLERVPNMRIIYLCENAWGHQDVYGVENVDAGKASRELSVESSAQVATSDSMPLNSALPRVYDLGGTIDFRLGGNSGAFTIGGWSISEPWGTWTDGDVSTIRLPTARPLSCPLELHLLVVAAFLGHGKQRTLGVLVNGVFIREVSFNAPCAGWWVHCPIPEGVVSRQQSLEVTLQFDPISSPSALGISEDTRRLGVGISEMKVCQAGPGRPRWNRMVMRVKSKAKRTFQRR